jgi:hypothetical protein
MNEYECFYAGRRWSCVADTSFEAQAMAVTHFKPPKSKRHMVFVLIVKKDGEAVSHKTGEV